MYPYRGMSFKKPDTCCDILLYFNCFHRTILTAWKTFHTVLFIRRYIKKIGINCPDKTNHLIFPAREHVKRECLPGKFFRIHLIVTYPGRSDRFLTPVNPALWIVSHIPRRKQNDWGDCPETCLRDHKRKAFRNVFFRYFFWYLRGLCAGQG